MDKLLHKYKNCVADFVHNSTRDFNNFVEEEPKKLKIAMQILNTKLFPALGVVGLSWAAKTWNQVPILITQS